MNLGTLAWSQEFNKKQEPADAKAAEQQATLHPGHQQHQSALSKVEATRERDQVRV